MTLNPALFTTNAADGVDTTKLRPSNWNRLVGIITSLFDGADATGSILVRDATDATDGASWLADVAAGSYLRSGGISVAPAWSALTLPNAAAQGDIVIATSANALGSLADVAVGSVLASGGVGAAPAWSTSPTLIAGTGAQTGKAPLSIFTSTVSASNVSTAETDLISYAMPANTLSANGQKVRITIWGSYAANVNSKSIRFYFGSTFLQVSAGSTQSNVQWMMTATVVRTGATSQIGIGNLMTGSAPSALIASAPAETLSGAVTIKVTGQSGTGSGDVTALGMHVEWIP